METRASGIRPKVDIGSAPSGTVCTVAGTIRRAGGELLTSPLGGRACVYWEVNRTVGDEEPERFEARDFWIEDATGRALVRAERIRVDARAERRKQAIAIVDADIQEVSARLRQIKKDRKSAAGKAASKLGGEQRRLKKLATLLCAIGAHARGNVHVGGSLPRQEAYIRERSKQFAQGEGHRALGLLGERYEVTLEEGASIEVCGLCEVTAVPNGVDHAGGYRQAPTCLQLRAPDGGELILLGLGEDAPTFTSTEEELAEQGARTSDSRGGSSSVRAILLLSVAVAVALTIWLLGR